MKKVLSILVLMVLTLAMASTALAEVEIKDFAFTMTDKSGGFYESSQTATKFSSNLLHGSVRVQSWGGSQYTPTKNVYAGLNFQGYIPACTFVWMNVSLPLSIRVTPTLNDATKTGTSYKYCAGMRLNTTETVATVKASGIFTPDGN